MSMLIDHKAISKDQMGALRENLLYPRELLTIEDARLDDIPAIPILEREAQYV